MNIEQLKKVKKDCLWTLLDLYKRANAGHIGSSLSCLDILIYLFFHKMKINDKCILSKGHAAAALYTVLAKTGRIKEKDLQTFYKNGTLLAAHPPCGVNRIPGVPFGTGSLGHGLSLAAGIAFSTKYTGKNRNVFCIISEGDCDEGSTWEAALFAGHHKLINLTVLIDNNQLQGFDKTNQVLNLEPLIEKWRSFNFDVAITGNGNHFPSIDATFSHLDSHKSAKPKCIIAKTTKGSGISFMENKLEWHYIPMSNEQYKIALKEIEKKYA